AVSKGMERRINDGYDLFHWSHHPGEDWPVNEYSNWLRSKGKEYKQEKIAECNHVVYGPDAEDHQATWCANKAIEFIEAHEHRQQPWLFSVNIFAPHHPFDPPKSYLKRYLDILDDIPEPNYVEGELNDKPEVQKRDHRGAYANPNLYPYCNMSDLDHKYTRAAYWAMCDLIDDQVGRMMETLEETGQLENTIVIFMSDHGEMLGDHGIYLKGPYFYEPAIKVPLIVSMPGTVLQGQRSTALVELVDIAPTLLEAAGLPRYPGMQGRSLWPMLTGEAPLDQHRDDIYCEYYNAMPWHRDPTAQATMVRTERYKLVAVHGVGGELYDLERDPNETHNQWDNPDYAPVKLELFSRLCDRMAYTVDPLPERRAAW